MEDQESPIKKREDRSWNRGAICVLAGLWSVDRDTVVYDEILAGLPPDIINTARRDGTLGWSGLSAYLKRKKSREVQ